MNIRQETARDFDKIYQLVKTAFETANVSNGKEQDFVNELRAGGKHIPELSLVMEQEGAIVGHIMLSKTSVKNDRQSFDGLLLGPVCTEEKLRNKGLGAKLVNFAIDKAKAMGHKAVFLAGDRNYYGRFGFVPASRYNIKCQYDIPAELLENILALELAPHELDGITGVL
jgi:putative acetyltransferase